MKILSTILIFFFYYSVCSAKNIYVSSLNGNDSDNGLTPATAWASLWKLNLMIPTGTVSGGDVILFERGSAFIGKFNVTKQISFDVYGSGNKPVISGFVTLNGWTNVTGNIWQCNPDTVLKKFCNILTINAVPQAVGRYPNGTTFLTFQNATTTQLVSSSLAGQNWARTEVVIRKIAYIAERAIVTSQSGNTLTYGTTPDIDACPLCTGSGNKNATEGTGFFFQRFRGSLDAQGEWYYNDTTNTMFLYTTVNPSGLTIKASYADTLVGLGSMANIGFNNIRFEGANKNVFFNKDGDGITITNCDFESNTRVVNFHNVGLVNVNNNTFNNTFNAGIFNYSSGKTFFNYNNNVFTNTGQLFGMGIFASESNLRVMYVFGNRIYNANQSMNIIGNRMIKTGSSVIYYQGSNITIRRNVIDTFNNLLDDGGAIYTYIGTANDGGDYRNRLVDSNFISNSVGASNGAGGSQSSAIYNDGFTKNMTAKHNTIYNLTGTLKGNGVQTSNPINVVLRNNTIYNTDVAINVNIINYADSPPFAGISGTLIDSNILYQKTNATTKFITRHINVNLFNPPLTIYQSFQSWYQDRNWISNQQANSYTFYYWLHYPNGYSGFKFYNLTQWRDTTLHDVNSILPPVTLTNTNTTLHVNPSDVPLTVNFTGFQKKDPKGVAYNDFAVIPRWSSRLLIDNGASTMNIPPVANAGANQVITLPQSSTSVTATATDADGTVVGYTWVKFSGPSGGNITTPNSATTTITALQAGTYIFQVTATDNLGATGTSQMQIIVNPVPNTAPTANAGADQTIQLPTNSTTLSGSGVDGDGSIVSYLWGKISGPTGGNISNPALPNPTVTALQLGTYQYQLTVTDNGGLQDKDTVQITVIAAANQAPTSVPGSDQNITLPTTTTSFNGSGSFDPDGTIIGYLWTFINGPSTPTIVSSTNSITNITGLSVSGEYTFSLRVTDNNGATDTKLIKVTVNAGNISPTANAGADQTITVPTSTVILSGSGTDPDGSITGYSWVKISGPTGGTVTNPTSPTTAVTALQQGTYVFRLIVTDNDGATGQDFMQVIVNPANIAPTANAGADQVITLPTNTTTLNGSGTDPDGSIVAYAWVKISGPSGGNITSPSFATTGITALQQGTYVYRLTVTDDDGATGQDFMQILVNPVIPPPNEPPTSNAGADQVITLPTNTTTLVGSGNDPDGTITAYFWTKISGPTGGAITSPTNSTTGITALIAGTYIYQLRVTDNDGDTATDAIQVTVNAANIAPSANAGTDQVITLPTSTTSLAGSGSDPDGTITDYLWTKISGPTGGTIATPTTSSTNISALQQGVYVFQLRVTDNSGDTATDAVQVTVNAANILPSANAGSDQVISLPTSTTNLVGSGSDPDGTITAYLWVKVSGPAGGTITSSTSATTGVTALQQGTYIYSLRVTGSGGASDTATDAMQIVVNAAPTPVPPTANAGSDKILLLPSNSTNLIGSGSDVDGIIVSYLWTKISGGAATITSPTSSNTTVTGLVAGVYEFELTVTDDDALTGKDTMQITVNTPPTADAGADVVITLPTNSTTLDGTGSITNIVTYSWVKLSGIGGAITSPSGSTTGVTGLVAGSYIYELTVTDNNGNTATDQVQVTVLPEDIPPSANAGANQAITLPINTVTLTGSGADPDGTIVGYNWQVISGPSGSNFGSATSATTTFNNLMATSLTVAGVYQVRLTVTDNNGGTGTDVVQITVNPVPIPPNSVLLKGYKVISN